MLFVSLVAAVGLYKTGIYRFDFLKDVLKKVDFQMNTNELNIPQDALSFSEQVFALFLPAAPKD